MRFLNWTVKLLQQYAAVRISKVKLAILYYERVASFLFAQNHFKPPFESIYAGINKNGRKNTVRKLSAENQSITRHLIENF